MKKTITKEFFAVLRSISVLSTLLKLAAIPIGIINAKLLSNVVGCATKGNYAGVIQSGSILLGILLLVKVFDAITQISYQKAESNALQKCKILLYKRYLSSPLHILYDATVGEANVMLASDFSTITNKIVGVYPTLISGIATVISYFIFLCLQSPIIAGILLGISCLQVLPPLFEKYFIEKFDVDDKEMEEQESNTVLECYNAFSTIKILGLKEWCLERMRKLHHEYWIVANRLTATYYADVSMSNLITNVLTYGTYAIVGLFIISQNITMDAGVQAIALAGSLYAAVKTSFKMIPNLGLAKVAEKRMGKFWAVETSNKQLLSSNPEIQFTNVSCVLGDRKTLDKVSLTIPSKGITVLKGENGAGKSTIVKLALGMVEASEGDIRVGGILPSQISYENYPHRIFYLPQEDAQYHLTPKELFESVLGNQNLEDVQYILKSFHIGDELYLQKICDLSGGERKKVFLALGLALKPSLLILDEPTNSLDQNSCEVLYEFLKKRENGTVVITHEEKLMSMASKVYEIGEGGIAGEY